ncbi:MAG: hypothetical protein LUQ13_03060 [Methanomicrobiales archaeon]|nr:hypothetical protein [Methanomicrobiales archaeon]
MNETPQDVLNLLRISDSFFPLGSFTVSQGMEQLVADRHWNKKDLAVILQAYLGKIWESFDLQVFFLALAAARSGDLGIIAELDDLCYAAKLSEENRSAVQRMGANLAEAIPFAPHSSGWVFRERIREGRAKGMYPVTLALAAETLHLQDQGGLSLIYVNLMEVVASLVRMAEIDYLEAQQVMEEVIRGIDPCVKGLADLHQSYPLVDIAMMRHETSQHRMFIS